jgi:hypothetical protein
MMMIPLLMVKMRMMMRKTPMMRKTRMMNVVYDCAHNFFCLAGALTS